MNLGLGLSIHSRRGGGSGSMGRGPSFESILLSPGVGGLSAIKPPVGVDLDRSHPQLQGCVAWWPMLEGSGTRARDYIGTRNGTLVNFAAVSAWGAGPSGSSPVFDAVDSKISFTSLAVSATAGYSVSFRARRAATGSTHSIIGNSGSTTIEYVHISATNLLVIETATNGDFAFAPLLVSDTNWHHYAVVASGTTVSMFQDGRRLTMTDADITNPSISFDQLGALSVSTQVMNGQIDDVRVYNRVLSQARVNDIMMNPWAPFHGWADQFI